MLKPGEFLLRMLNGLMPNSHEHLLKAKQDPLTYQQFFADRSSKSFASFGELNLTGLEVLDVGCGLGANIVHLYELGAERVVGIDISVTQALCTQQMLREGWPDLAARTSFVGTDASCMPFADNSFDVLVAADTFEHVEALEPALKECARVLKPGGYLYAYFPPFYSPWGAHMVNWIRLPWCQVLFSEQTVLNVARQFEAEGKSINSLLPPETRLSLGTGKTIPFVSHLTVNRFLRIAQEIREWQVVKTHLLPPNWRTSSFSNRFLQPINRLPVVQEMFTAKAVFIIQKNTAV